MLPLMKTFRFKYLRAQNYLLGKKSLYGLKQAPREWNQMINGVLLDICFEPLEADPCIYKKTVRGMVNGAMKCKHYIIALYVDDLLIACSTPQMCNGWREPLRNTSR